MLAILGLSGEARATGLWTALATPVPNGASVQTMLLLPDGTVMAKTNKGGGDGEGNLWYKLTPDIHGSYINGTWTTLSAMHDTRRYFSTQVLKDGRVFVAGGEYGSGFCRSEIYDHVTDTWTQVPVPTNLLNPALNSPVVAGKQGFYDSDSTTLPNGNVLVTPVGPRTAGATMIFDVANNTWIAGPKPFRGSYQDEASWVKLPDNSILTIDPFGTNSERYIPSLNAWVDDAIVPVDLYDVVTGELGAAFLLPNGKAFFLGSTGQTAIYTPSGNNSPGSWIAGPVIPNSQGTPDAAAAMMVNGIILCATTASKTFSSDQKPTSYYEYDYLSNSFTRINGPEGTLTTDQECYFTTMLDLPDGTVLFSEGEGTSQLYVYQPAGSPLPVGKPTITSITRNSDGSYHATGTLFNGISQGAAYGDDWQMDTNYPIVRLVDSSNNVYYCRSFNWSSNLVMTGSTPVTTEFALPAGLPFDTYSLVVIANGISSDPVVFAPFPVITSPATATGRQDQAFQYQITATNSPTSYDATGLPAGLSVNTSTGLISGTPTSSGVSAVVVSATNVGGTGTLDLTLTIVFPTPVVTTGAATLVTNNSATLAGTVNPQGVSTTATMKYGTTTSYGSTASLTLSPDDGITAQNVSAALTGLTGNTTYHYQVSATNSYGTTTGLDATFLTLVDATLVFKPAGGSKLASGATIDLGPVKTGLTGSFNFTITNTGGVNLTLGTITVDGTDNADFNVSGAPATPVAPGASTTLTLDFTPGALGLRVAELHIPTNDPLNPTYDLVLNGTGSLAGTSAATQVSAAWATLNGSANPNGKASTAHFEYGTTTGYGTSTYDIDLGSGTSDVPVNFNVAGLAHGTLYHVRLVMINADGTYYGNDRTFVTPASSPPNWHNQRLSATANAAGGNRTGVPHGSWWLYYYKGTDNHIWGVYWSGTQWTQSVLTTTANVDDWLAFYAGWNIVYYKGTDNHLWCLFFNGSSWQQQQLSTTPNVAGDVVIDKAWGAVYYRGTDGVIWAAYWDGAAWQQASLLGTANVNGSLSTDVAWHAIYYQGTDNFLWCYYWTGAAWLQVQLSTTADVGGSVTGDSGGVVYYRSLADNSGWADYWSGSAWVQTQLDATASLLGPTTLYGRFNEVYLNGSGQCEALYWSGTKWSSLLVGDGGSGLTGGLSVHSATHWIFVRRNDGTIVIFYFQ